MDREGIVAKRKASLFGTARTGSRPGTRVTQEEGWFLEAAAAHDPHPKQVAVKLSGGRADAGLQV